MVLKASIFSFEWKSQDCINLYCIVMAGQVRRKYLEQMKVKEHEWDAQELWGPYQVENDGFYRMPFTSFNSPTYNG